MLRPSALRLEKKDDKSTGPDPCPPRVGRDQKNEGQGGRGKGGIGPKESSGGTASDGRVVIGDFGGKTRLALDVVERSRCMSFQYRP